MEIYQAKNINKEDIDNIVKIIHKKFEEEKSKVVEEHRWNQFYYNTPIITLNNIKFSFNIFCSYFTGKINYIESWTLKCEIPDVDDKFDFDKKDNMINYKYFKSNTIRELIVKYVNNKFVYDKYDNKIMRYDDYLEEECVRKLFHTNIECCVCYDNLSGNFKTKCGHNLCLECYTQIKGKKKCPMCKACLCCGEQQECNDDY